MHIASMYNVNKVVVDHLQLTFFCSFGFLLLAYFTSVIHIWPTGDAKTCFKIINNTRKLPLEKNLSLLAFFIIIFCLNFLTEEEGKKKYQVQKIMRGNLSFYTCLSKYSDLAENYSHLSPHLSKKSFD